MASPPFSLGTSLPGDSDIVSQFPALDRGDKDIIQSWILANHDANGNHVVAIFPWQSSTPSTPGSSLTTLFVNASGRLQYVQPDGTVHNVGVEPAAIIYRATTTIPPGYLVADGSAVSRTTYADIFAVTGTFFGTGDGSSTFNLPNIGGRVIAGVDTGGLISNLPGTFGVSGGEQQHTLSVGELASHFHAAGIFDPSHTHGVSGGIYGSTALQFNYAGGGGQGGFGSGIIINAAGTGVRVTSSNGLDNTYSNGSSSPHNNLQPMIVLTALIKT